MFYVPQKHSQFAAIYGYTHLFSHKCVSHLCVYISAGLSLFVFGISVWFMAPMRAFRRTNSSQASTGIRNLSKISPFHSISWFKARRSYEEFLFLILQFKALYLINARDMDSTWKKKNQIVYFGIKNIAVIHWYICKWQWY